MHECLISSHPLRKFSHFCFMMESINELLVLDGGLATELERNGFSFLGDPLWSARVLHEYPESIINVHRSYLQNGADIITTASYQASIPGFQKHLGLTFDQSRELVKLSVELAKKARNEQCRTLSKGSKNILIAGSVGSYGAALADGSEYSGNYCDKITHEELISWHRTRIECLIEAGVDLLALETIPAVKEGEALMKLLRDLPDVKAWLSFSCQSMHQTAHMEDISSAALKCIHLSSPSQLVAVGVNCCSPEFAESLLKDISSVSHGFPTIVYPNSGEIWDTAAGWSGNKSKSKQTYLESWVNSSAKIIGGCCRTTPEDIFEIFKFVEARKQSELY